ncbi:hypothetical protein [Pseudobacteriovorax antillogorgiicola]|uniref:Response regulatory domain-containing protein n=1 Tax=Pseudobacteriovorax antillogorgiicola TaxID=1513793 RepID=A0A1Y6CE84_9BACT|nr:hypothetical protein [Pseudobacteriovorax antillogorgiicola]TCS51817.1 hypothetical protein EDD56_110202 [Pseudobacteriovorax antillogorgiicola]SMF50234.1 hypothetical protein SAMN06296036_115171 [Pseudobacteriovorax antillogorgiicola]
MSSNELKLILVDPDAKFAESVVAEAARHDIHVDHYKNMMEIGYLGRFKDYDVAILNETLEKMTGLEIAEYFDKLLGNMPMVLLHGNPSSILRDQWPRSVVSFVAKGDGVSKVLDAAIGATRHSFAEPVVGEQEA